MGLMDRMRDAAEVGDQKTAARAQEREREAAARRKAEFWASPVGRARAAYERGDKVFQYAHDVMSQQAIVVAMVGSTTSKSTTDPSEVLNAVSNEGWDLVNGSFVFIEE